MPTAALYFALVLTLGEFARRWMRAPPDITRKGVLVALGAFALPSVTGVIDPRSGAAALVGRRRGTRRFHFFGHSRTMEGTLTLFLVASASTAPVLGILGGLDWHQAVAFALIAGTVAAAVETISVYGTDNATVPLSVAATLLLLTGATG